MGARGPVFFSIIFLISVFGLILDTIVVIKAPVLVARILKVSSAVCNFARKTLTLNNLYNKVLATVMSRGLGVRGSCILLLTYSTTITVVKVSLFLGVPTVMSC